MKHSKKQIKKSPIRSLRHINNEINYQIIEVQGSIRICDPVLNPCCDPSNLRFKLEERD